MLNLAVLQLVPRAKQKSVMIFGPKGGLGKTTIAAHLLVAAAKAGYSHLASISILREHWPGGFLTARTIRPPRIWRSLILQRLKSKIGKMFGGTSTSTT